MIENSGSTGKNGSSGHRLIFGAPDHHPENRQFARLKNHGVLADHTGVGWQKQGRTGGDHIATAGNNGEDADDARDKTGSPNKDTEGKEPQSPKDLSQDKSLVVQAEKE